MAYAAANNGPKVLKEINCYMLPDISNRLLVLLHKNRSTNRPLETEYIKETRIKASLDHLEMHIEDGRLASLKTSTEKKSVCTLRSIPEKIHSTLLGYFINGECHLIQLKGDFLIMDNVKEPIKISEFLESQIDSRDPAFTSFEKPTVVTARMRSEAEIFGAKRLASRRKTADNDEDLRYLSELCLTPWRPTRFKPYKSLYAYENRLSIMCTSDNILNSCQEFTRENWESILLAPLRNDAPEVMPGGAEQAKKQTLEELVRNLLLKVQIIKFEKLVDYLRERSSDDCQVTPTAVIACLNKCSVLLKGWWAIRSDILYPPNTFSEHAAIPSAQLVRARDYMMAVFHRGGHLTRKTVSSVTKLPSLEVTEILELLGNRISSGGEEHSNHWEFRQPDDAFIRSHPDVVHQHAEKWELRIRQLCSQLKLDVLVTDTAQRRRRCSVRLSGSDTDDIRSSLSSPRARRRCRLLSCSPEQQKQSSPSLIYPPAAKRVRTKSASTSDAQITASTSNSKLSLPPLLTPLESAIAGGQLKSPGPQAASRPTPSPFGGSHPTSPSLPLSVPTTKRVSLPPISSISAQKETSSPLPVMVTTDPSTDLLKQEPRSPGHRLVEADLPGEQAPLMPKLPTTSRDVVSEKIEEPDLTVSNHDYSMVDDPEILTFVKEKLRTLPILALSELTKDCQPFLASLGTNPMSKNGLAPPPGSEAERTMLSSELYKVVIAVGGRELKINWPKVTWALPKQPLFVAPMADEFGDPGSPYIRVREAILERLEENQFVTFGYIKQKLIDTGLKISDNNLRTTIKRYCIYRQSKYFLRFTVDERP